MWSCCNLLLTIMGHRNVAFSNQLMHTRVDVHFSTSLKMVIVQKNEGTN